ncbi:hypothetical protein ACFZDG_39765, partial [Kitasatospora xanthocidica]
MKPTSPNATPRPPTPPHHSTNARACSRTCPTDAADNTTNTPGNTHGTRTDTGACPTTTCAFVPENPNALTAANREPSAAGTHSRNPESTTNGEPSNTTPGFASRKCTNGGTTPCRNASTAF